jgi:VWFA-related protein
LKLALVLLLTTPLVAQETLQARSNLVILDVTVTDHNHNPVHNLQAIDFTLKENGTPQTIKSFEEHAPTPPTPVPEQKPLPPGVFTNYTPIPPTSPVSIILIDHLNTPTQDQQTLHGELVAFVQKLKPGTPVAIFTLNTQIVLLQGFTTDPKLLLDAIDSKQALPRPFALLNDSMAASNVSAHTTAITTYNKDPQPLVEMSQITQIRLADTGVPGLLCTSSRERDWTKRSGRWRRARSIQLNRL